MAKAKEITLVSGASNIETMLKKLKVQGATLAFNTHVACLSVLAHVYEHSDVRMVTRLLECVHDMTRKNAVKAWFEFFGPVSFDGKEVKFVARFTDDPTAKAHAQLQAKAEPFYDFAPEPEYKPVDAAAMLHACIAKLKKDQTKTERDHTLLISALDALIEKPAG